MRQRIVLVLLIALAIVPAAYATCGGGGGGGMGGIMPRGGMMGQNEPPRAYVVPWRVLKPEDPPLTTPLIVYWFPASMDQAKTASLNNSRLLTIYAAQCVGLQLVTPDDTATIEKWGVKDKLPLALLAGDGKEVAHVLGDDGGVVQVSDVENMIHHELYNRGAALQSQLDDGEAKAKAGDHDGAVAVYQKVWEQRCLAPDKGRAAQKALRRLGVRVADANLRESDPVVTPEMNARMMTAMDQALAAEIAADYPLARKLYAEAAALDPADPVPPRFLGELYRHETGEWKLAMATFEKVLTMQPDPLSRAVALHGIGKMTIHMGDSAKGLDYFEKSIAAYPLALTYRNLAVYWNSERQRAKADGYVKKALALDPDDGYNLIFAATYMADSGRQAEALKIAQENENVLSASYNLAAIYALLGNKGKAMELLHRHFYQYERYDAVRAKEMWEARVDYVFASLKNDPEFLKLTAMAQ